MKVDNFIESSLREEQHNQNLSELEYDKIFNMIEDEVVKTKAEMPTYTANLIKKLIKKFKKCFSFQELIQVAAFIVVLIFVPLLCREYIIKDASSNNNIKTRNEINKASGKDVLANFKWGYCDKIITAYTPLYQKANSSSLQIKKMDIGTLVMVENAAKDIEGKVWLQVVIPTDSSYGNRGWITESCCDNALAIINAKGKNISDQDIKKLAVEYLNYLQLDRIGPDKRIVEYKISEVKMGPVKGVHVIFNVKYDVKPYDAKKFSLYSGDKVDKDGWVRNIKSVGEVIRVKDYYSLIDILEDSSP